MLQPPLPEPELFAVGVNCINKFDKQSPIIAHVVSKVVYQGTEHSPLLSVTSSLFYLDRQLFVS